MPTNIKPLGPKVVDPRMAALAAQYKPVTGVSQGQPQQPQVQAPQMETPKAAPKGMAAAPALAPPTQVGQAIQSGTNLAPPPPPVAGQPTVDPTKMAPVQRGLPPVASNAPRSPAPTAQPLNTNQQADFAQRVASNNLPQTNAGKPNQPAMTVPQIQRDGDINARASDVGKARQQMIERTGVATPAAQNVADISSGSYVAGTDQLALNPSTARDPNVKRPSDFMSFGDYAGANQQELKRIADTAASNVTEKRKAESRALTAAQQEAGDTGDVTQTKSYSDYLKAKAEADKAASSASLGTSDNPYEAALRGVYSGQQQQKLDTQGAQLQQSEQARSEALKARQSDYSKAQEAERQRQANNAASLAAEQERNRASAASKAAQEAAAKEAQQRATQDAYDKYLRGEGPNPYAPTDEWKRPVTQTDEQFGQVPQESQPQNPDEVPPWLQDNG